MPFLTDKMEETKRANLQKTAIQADNVLTGEASHNKTSSEEIVSRFKFDINFIERELRANIVGQDQVIDELLDTLHIVQADICDPRRPLATLLFTGPTGVGKTEIVRTIARAFYGDADRMCRVDMNTLAQEHYSAAFTGAPPGYVGSKEGTTILDQEMIEGSHSMPGIVLFDELEKASNEVAMALLNVFDNGTLTVASGERTYSFRNAIIFMTSNIGAKELIRFQENAPKYRLLNMFMSGRHKKNTRNIVEGKLLDRFPPEFVNRIDHINVFNWLDKSVMRDLVNIELQRLNNRLSKHHLKVVLDKNVIELLTDKGHDRRFGARSLRRAMRKWVEFPLARVITDWDTALNTDAGEICLYAKVTSGVVGFKKWKPK